MTVGSMFSGIGGLDLGFERAGFRVAWMVERDPFCAASLARNFPGVPVYPDARMSVAAWRSVPRVDVIIGGFPCQDVSNAGLRRGLAGERSGLWWCIRRAARVLRPSYVVVENVPGLFAQGIDTVLGSLARLRFDAEWTVIRASDVGAPHKRARVFIVAYPERDARRDEQQRSERRPTGDWQESCEASPRRLAYPANDGRHELGASHDDDRCDAPGNDAHGRDPAVADTQPPGRREMGADVTRDGGGACGASGAVGQSRGHGVAEPLADALGTGPQGHRPTWTERRGELAALCADGRADAWSGWPARPGERQHDWEPPRVVLSSRAQRAMGDRFDGVSGDVAGWRRRALQATGNAVVPQVAEVVARRVLALAEAQR